MGRLIMQLGRSRMILGLIVVMGLALGYLSYSQADDPIVGLMANQPIVRSGNLESFANLKIDFEILDDERYRSLQIFGENPVDPGIIGERKNPFAPL